MTHTIPEILVNPLKEWDEASPATQAPSGRLGPRGGRPKHSQEPVRNNSQEPVRNNSQEPVRNHSQDLGLKQSQEPG